MTAQLSSPRYWARKERNFVHFRLAVLNPFKHTGSEPLQHIRFEGDRHRLAAAIGVSLAMVSPGSDCRRSYQVPVHPLQNKPAHFGQLHVGAIEPFDAELCFFPILGIQRQ